LPPGHLGAAKLDVGVETAALASGGVVGVVRGLGADRVLVWYASL
jgi:hypothetical protein